MFTSANSDTRNQVLIPPTQLRKSRPSLSVPSQMATNDAQPETRPQHSRTPSFFTFGSKKSAQQQVQRALSQVQRRPSTSPSSPSQSHVLTHTKRPSLGEDPSLSTSPTVQREIKSVVDLVLAHAHKIYFSGPLVRRVERLPDGNKPTRDDGWVDVWAQLGGTTLSVWDMKAIEEASKRGEEVPPSYINVTDSFVQVLGALTSPSTATAPARRQTNVITINNAGSNLIFFACPSSAALVSWATALRLAAWEKSRLEEIYTAHLLRMSLSDGDVWKEPVTTLVKGRLEGQVKVRIAGQTDWKPFWMVLSSATDPSASAIPRPTSPLTSRSKGRVSNLFSRSQSPPPVGPSVPVISFYASQRPKDRKKALLTMRYVTQAFAVYPERPEVIQRSTLMKIEGVLGQEDLGGGMKGKGCWLMLMPETQQIFPVYELLKWLIAFHDTYSLYGRPGGYIWDPRQPQSMWFSYPIGTQREHLFVDREAAERLDPRDDRTFAIRKELKQILITRMYGSEIPPGPGPPQGQPAQARQDSDVAQSVTFSTSNAPILPPIQLAEVTSTSTPQLPPLSFGDMKQQQQQQPVSPKQPEEPPQPYSTPSFNRAASLLTPITESSPVERKAFKAPSISSLTETTSFNAAASVTTERESSQTSDSILTRRQGTSPTAAPHPPPPLSRGSEDSFASSRPDSKLALSASFDQPESRLSTENAPQSRRSPSNRSLTSIPHSSPITPTSLTSSTADPHGKVQSSSPISGLRSPRSLQSAPAPAPPSTSPLQTSERPLVKLSQLPSIRPASPLSSPKSPFLSKSTEPPSPPPKSDRTTTFTAAPRNWPQPPANRPALPLQPPEAPSVNNDDLVNEPGAIYLLQQQRAQDAPQRLPETWTTEEEEDEDEEEEDEDEEEEEDSDFTGPERNPPPRRATPPVRMQPPSAYRMPPEILSENQTNPPLRRHPSGARAKPSPRHNSSPLETAATSFQPSIPPPIQEMDDHAHLSSGYDDNSDALAALSFLDHQEEAAPPPPKQTLPVQPTQKEQVATSNEIPHYPSTFATSRQAAERKAKAQAQQEASYAATHLPGKPNGNARKKKKDQGAWDSSEEEEDEEEEDDEDDGSDDERPQVQVRQPQPLPASDPRVSVYPSAQPGLQGTPSMTGEGYGQRQLRILPQPPVRTGDLQDQHPRTSPGQNDDRPRTHLGDEPRGHTINPHVAARQSVWSTVLDPNPPPRNTSGRDTFVQVDESETMTKAFQPQGLLSAGLQDKEDRSAKRQEELARETGASLINVPNKPPPPQTGLLGAITAHERERKREGGVGAALTEKERERRLAEERQRKLDELQRQQLDQMSQGGAPGAYDPYGQQQFAGFTPGFDPRMSMNPMMLNPYMAGGFPMMPFGNPQQMMAAQMAAQQAYQQAMMTFSQAGGSQMGDNMSRVGPPPAMGPSSSVPMGSPAPMPMQGGMMGMDPRMSMGMNPWMAGGMGMNVMGGMGMNPGMNPMGMVDPRMSMGPQTQFHRPDSVPGQQGRLSSHQGTPSPRQGSPAPQRSSNNNSPRPPT
ncbi:hypothetical protein K439DRAFT_764625 [Ramaria rubella]|nr:hypothetical protein K439DRAFT_764625 [Ramaria rubella]